MPVQAARLDELDAGQSMGADAGPEFRAMRAGQVREHPGRGVAQRIGFCGLVLVGPDQRPFAATQDHANAGYFQAEGQDAMAARAADTMRSAVHDHRCARRSGKDDGGQRVGEQSGRRRGVRPDAEQRASAMVRVDRHRHAARTSGTRCVSDQISHGGSRPRALRDRGECHARLRPHQDRQVIREA